jgi:hypothetical protein
MTEPNRRQLPNFLEQATAALRATPLPDGPSSELIASTTQALEQAGNVTTQGLQHSRRKLMFRQALFGSIGVAAAVLLGLGAFFAFSGKNRSHEEPAYVEVDGTNYAIRGPFTHEDLTVFLLCSDHQDTSDFLTLDEGLKSGLVTITEQEQERVGALRIENQSDRPLYLQEGERLVGGKQDRTLISSLVIPPQSGKTSVPTFCVEHSRWVEGDKGSKFGFSVNPALAPKGVRAAAKVEGSQDRVWGCVAAQKDSANKTLHCPNTNSSVNEMLDAPQVQAISEEYAAALEKALHQAETSDALGMAIVFNGQIEEVNLYPNRALFCKLFPRLIRAYAVQAALLRDQAKGGQPLTEAAIAQFLADQDAKSQKTKSLDAHNEVQVNELDGSRFQCTTCYNGRSIHWQVIAKNRRGGTAGAEVLGSDW